MIFPLKSGEEWTLTPDKYKLIDERFPLIDIDIELEKLKTWLLFNENRQKTARGMMKTIGHWMSNDSIPKARRRPMTAPSHNKAKWDKGVKPWLESKTSLAEIEANQSFVAMLSGPEFRVWAERTNPLVKEI